LAKDSTKRNDALQQVAMTIDLHVDNIDAEREAMVRLLHPEREGEHDAD
jgi:hypothetical protein